MWYQFATCIIVFVAPLLIAPGICVDAFFVPKSAWIAVAGWSLLVAWLSRIPGDRRAIPRLGIELPLLAVLLTMVLSIAASGADPMPQILALVLVLLFAGLLYLFAHVWLRSDHVPSPHPLDWALVAGILVSVYVLFQSYGLDPFDWQGGVPDWRGKLTGTMGGPNFVAGYLALVLPWSVYRIWSTKGRAAVLSLSAFAVLLAALVVTFSVGAWSGILAAGVFATIVRLRARRSSAHKRREARSRKPSMRFIIAIGISVFIFGFYLLNNPWNSVGRSLLTEASESPRWRTGHGARRFIWKTTALMVRDQPVFGVGFDNYYRVHQIYQGELYRLRGTPHDRPTVSNVPQVHNEYYQQLAETGVVGFFALLWLLVAGVKRIRSNWAATPAGLRPPFLAASAALLAGGVHALTSFPLRTPPTALLLTLLAAYVLADPAGRSGSKATFALSWAKRVMILLVAAPILMAAFWVGLRSVLANAQLLRSMQEWRGEPIIPASRAVRLYPYSHQAHDHLARLYAATGDFDKALLESQKALRYREAFHTRKLRRDCYVAMGRWSEAAEEGRRMLDLNPMYPPLIMEQARLEKMAGGSVDDLLDRAQDLIPKLIDEGNRNQASALAKQIADLDPSRQDRLRSFGNSQD